MQAPAAGLSASGQPAVVRNEIDEFIEGRYIGASEALWRIYGFETHGMNPTVERLAVHLPGQQSVVFSEESSLGIIASQGEPETTLTAWFQLNHTDTDARKLLYQDIPSKYTWHESGAHRHTWTKRDGKHFGKVRLKQEPVGRMYFVKPNQGQQAREGREMDTLLLVRERNDRKNTRANCCRWK